MIINNINNIPSRGTAEFFFVTVFTVPINTCIEFIHAGSVCRHDNRIFTINFRKINIMNGKRVRLLILLLLCGGKIKITHCYCINVCVSVLECLEIIYREIRDRVPKSNG